MEPGLADWHHGSNHEVTWAALNHDYVICAVLVHGGNQSHGCDAAANYGYLFVGVVEVGESELRMCYRALEILDAWDLGLENLWRENR